MVDLEKSYIGRDLYRTSGDTERARSTKGSRNQSHEKTPRKTELPYIETNRRKQNIETSTPMKSQKTLEVQDDQVNTLIK